MTAQRNRTSSRSPGKFTRRAQAARLNNAAQDIRAEPAPAVCAGFWSPQDFGLRGLFLFYKYLYNRMAMATGCSIPVVRAHGVGVDWVQFPAARPKKSLSLKWGTFLLLKVLIVWFLSAMQNNPVFGIVDKAFAYAINSTILNVDSKGRFKDN
jgi:hypothetical protein